jgi:uncharacterized membrane protein
MALLTTVLAVLHILTAMGWLGGALLFGFVISPSLAKLSRPASREFALGVAPGVLRFFQVIAGATILFGLLLLYNMTNGDFSQLSFSSVWGRSLLLGMTTALAAFVLTEAVTVPAFQRVVALNGRMRPDGSEVPPELPSAVHRAGRLALANVLLLMITLGLMVSAGFY